MAQKAFRSTHNNKKEKGEGKKNKPKTAYQLARDAENARKKRKGNYAI